MPFVQRVVEPKCLSKTSLTDAEGKVLVDDYELEAVANNTLCNALRQLASLVLVADDIFQELKGDLQKIAERAEKLKGRIGTVDGKVAAYDPKKISVPESDIANFALLKTHYHIKHEFHTNLFERSTRSRAVRELYEAAAKTPIHLMRQLDRWRRDGHRSSRFFMCTPILGNRRRRVRNKVDIEIETRMPALVEDLRRWTSTEALGDVTVTTDGGARIRSNTTMLAGHIDGDITDGTVVSDDEGIDHKLPSPEEQLQVVALKFPAEIVAVDVTGRNFDRMSVMRRSLMNGESVMQQGGGGDGSTIRRRSKSRKPRNRRRNTLAGTDQKEIRDALVAADEQSNSAVQTDEAESPVNAPGVGRSKSSDLLRKKDSPDIKKSHFNTLKQWGKKMIANYTDTKSANDDEDVSNIYETVTLKRKRNVDKERKSMHERKPSCSSSEKSSINIPINTPLTAAMNIASVKLRDSSAQRRLRRSGGNKDEPHSSSGNWSASSESGRASIGSEITTTTQPKSTTSAATSSNSLNLHPPSSVNSRRRYLNTSAPGSVTSEGTLTPDIIHDLHEDGETSSVYSCDTEGYYTSFHMDSGLKTLKEEDSPATPLHSTSTFSNSASTAENEYELFGKGSTSTTTSSAGTVCTTLRAAVSSRSLIIGPAVPERISSLSKLSNKSQSPESSLERDYSSEKTGTVKRSPATTTKIIAEVHQKDSDGDVSPDSGHNTSSSPIESINSPNGVRSGSEFEYSESSDMEGADRIERIRVKTTINSSRIPSMCVITPTQSDDESVKSNQFDENQINNNLNVSNKSRMKSSEGENNNNVKKIQVINVNAQTGYATIETQVASATSDGKASHRAASPSGGTMIVKQTTPHKSPQLQPIFKATLMPLNNMLGKLKLNLNFSNLRSGKSPIRTEDNTDSGEYVTIADVKNNNEKANIYANDVVNRNLTTVLSGKIRETEYISLNELPCNESDLQTADSELELERRRRGARVTLNAEGKVIYSSDSLKRRRGAHTTFEPGPFVNVKQNSPTQSPLVAHRTLPKPKSKSGIRTDEGQPLSPQLGKVVIKATNGTSEIVRMPPSTIVSPTSPTKHFNTTRGAYVNVLNEGRAISPSNQSQLHSHPHPHQPEPPNYYAYNNQMPINMLSREFENSCNMKRGTNMYSTLPNRKPQYTAGRVLPERSVTPDIMRGLGNVQYNSLDRKDRIGQHYNLEQYDLDLDMGPDEFGFEGFVEYPPPQQQQPQFQHQPMMQNYPQNLGIPVQIPQVNMFNLRSPQVPQNNYQAYQHYDSPKRELPQMPMTSGAAMDSFRVSPIDPRNLGMRTSTPAKVQELKAAAHLESKMLSPKKSSMTNEELYAVIHKTKKKMNIQSEEIDRPSPSLSPVSSESSMTSNKSNKPETGYLGDKSKSRLSWSPNGEYIDFNTNIDKIPPESRSRLSWACSADSNKKDSQTSRLDFKRLLLMHGKAKFNQPSKKLSAVEQLKMSKHQIEQQQKREDAEAAAAASNVSILDLSQSPRTMRNRKFVAPGSPNKNSDKDKRPVPKLLSPRSQWRFANPRTDVLSSTIPEDCQEDDTLMGVNKLHEDETPSFKDIKQRFEELPKKEPSMTATQRLQAQRAQFFASTPVASSTQATNASNNAPRFNSFTNNASKSPHQPQAQVIRDQQSSPTLETAF